jgi:hypothetical protein
MFNSFTTLFIMLRQFEDHASNFGGEGKISFDHHDTIHRQRHNRAHATSAHLQLSDTVNYHMNRSLEL